MAEAKREERAKREKLLLSEATAVVAEKDPQRLHRETKASERNRVCIEDLDNAVRRRVVSGAHSATIAYGGYDLKYSGRAKPNWCKAANF